MCYGFCLLAWLVDMFQVSLLMLLWETMFSIHMSLLEKTHWLNTYRFRLTGRCLSRKISLYIPKNTPSFFYSFRNFLFCYVFHCYCLSQIFTLVSFSVSVPSVCMLSVVSVFAIRWFLLYVFWDKSLSFLLSRCLTDVPCLLLLGLYQQQILGPTVFLHLCLFFSLLAGHFKRPPELLLWIIWGNCVSWPQAS